MSFLLGNSVVFRTYDIHSGVRTIEWRLFDNHTGTEMEHGRQTLAARKINLVRHLGVCKTVLLDTSHPIANEVNCFLNIKHSFLRLRKTAIQSAVYVFRWVTVTLSTTVSTQRSTLVYMTLITSSH